MPGSRVNLGNGGHKTSKGRAMKKAKGGAVMDPPGMRGGGAAKKAKGRSKMKPPGMKNGGDPLLYKKNGGGLEMTEVDGKKVPKYAADGKGANDLMKRGAVKKAKGGALMKKKKPTGG